MVPRKSVRKALKKFKKNAVTKSSIEQILGNSSKRSKALWLILFLCSSSVLIYELQKILRAFIERPTLISLRKREMDAMSFPALTFCQGSTLSRSSIPKEYFAFADPERTKYLFSEYNFLVLRAFLALQYFSHFSSIKEVLKTMMNPRELFLASFESSCIFGIHHLCNYPENITHLLTSSYSGICFQLNTKGNMMQRDPGQLYGLSMVMFVNQSDYIPFSTFDAGSGILLKVHEPGEYPFPDLDSIPVSPGFLTRISLRKIKNMRLKTPYPSNCTDGENIELYYPGKYSIANCKRSCMVRDSLADCGSTDPLTMMLLNQTGKRRYKKINATTMECIYKSAGKSTSKEKRECHCPIPCNEVLYIPTISQTRWPSKADLPYYKYIFAHTLGLDISKVTDEYIYDNFIKLNIYFDEMSYLEIREKNEWTLEKLISDIGGQMGVWIGASILSLFHLVFSLLRSVRRFLFKKRKKRIIEVQESNLKTTST